MAGRIPPIDGGGARGRRERPPLVPETASLGGAQASRRIRSQRTVFGRQRVCILSRKLLRRSWDMSTHAFLPGRLRITDDPRQRLQNTQEIGRIWGSKTHFTVWISEVMTGEGHGPSGTRHGTSGTESRFIGNDAQGISGTAERYIRNALGGTTRADSPSRQRFVHSLTFYPIF